jgi:hypothetical protein
MYVVSARRRAAHCHHGTISRGELTGGMMQGKWMNARHDSRCENFAECETKIAEGDKIYFNGHAYCESCGEIQAEEDKKGTR